MLNFKKITLISIHKTTYKVYFLPLNEKKIILSFESLQASLFSTTKKDRRLTTLS